MLETADRAKAALRLSAVLWTFVARHEPCVARAASTTGFDVVAAVPSICPGRDSEGALRGVVERCWPLQSRHRRALVPTGARTAPHVFATDAFRAPQRLDGRSVLLIEDTWAPGARARSAAVAVRAAGAATAAVGRHLNGWYADTARRLGALPAYHPWSCSMGVACHPTGQHV